MEDAYSVIHNYSSGMVLGSRYIYITQNDPPRLLGDGCGCIRQKIDDYWKMEFCERHGREVYQKGLGIVR